MRTLYDGDAFLKFSLNVRITNCLRKNASYELSGAVALTRLLAPALADLATRFPGSAVLREPAFRSLALPGADGRPDTELLEGFGVIVREGLSQRLLPGTTPLLAAAVADEYPTSPAHISRLLDGAGPQAADPRDQGPRPALHGAAVRRALAAPLAVAGGAGRAGHRHRAAVHPEGRPRPRGPGTGAAGR